MQTIAGIRIPDSTLARDAHALAQEHSADFLLRHCQRTYVLGARATRAAGLQVHEELGYVAALLHDLGLTDTYASTRRFEVAGAHVARDWALANGLSRDEAQVIWDAVALHTTDGIADARTPEGALVTWGAKTDVLGLAPGQLDADAARAVHTALPRDDFPERFFELIAAARQRTVTDPAPDMR